MFCWNCNKEINSNEVYRSSECPSCHASLHCCKGCCFYEEGRHFDCKESVDDIVTDKERSNFCEYFSPIKESVKTDSSKKSKADEAKDAFNALFGGIVCL